MIVIVITIVIIIVISSIYQLLYLISDSSRLTWKGTQRDLIDEWRYSNVARIWNPHGSERFVQLLKLKTMALPWFFRGFTKKDMVWPWFYHGVTSGLLWTFRIHHGFDKTSSVFTDQALRSTPNTEACMCPSRRPLVRVQLGSRLTQETMQFVGYVYLYIYLIYIYIYLSIYIYMAILDCESGYWWLELIEIPAVCGSCFLLVEPSTVWQHFHSYFTLFHRSHFFKFICFGESFAIPS